MMTFKDIMGEFAPIEWEILEELYNEHADQWWTRVDAKFHAEDAKFYWVDRLVKKGFLTRNGAHYQISLYGFEICQGLSRLAKQRT